VNVSVARLTPEVVVSSQGSPRRSTWPRKANTRVTGLEWV
jgi:hypothetical protein